MNSARESILGKLKRRHTSMASAASQLSKYTAHCAFQNGELIKHFTEQCTNNHIDVLPASKQNWLGRLESVLAKHKVSNVIMGQAGEELEQAYKMINPHTQYEVMRFDTPIENIKPKLFNDIDAGITTAFAGVAQTGSIILTPDANQPRTLSLVPPLHIVLLKESQVVRTLSEAFEMLTGTAEHAALQRSSNILVISSPSKTADIQQTLAYGAHGPINLALILIDDK